MSNSDDKDKKKGSGIGPAVGGAVAAGGSKAVSHSSHSGLDSVSGSHASSGGESIHAGSDVSKGFGADDVDLPDAQKPIGTEGVDVDSLPKPPGTGADSGGVGSSHSGRSTYVHHHHNTTDGNETNATDTAEVHNTPVEAGFGPSIEGTSVSDISHAIQQSSIGNALEHFSLTNFLASAADDAGTIFAGAAGLAENFAFSVMTHPTLLKAAIIAGSTVGFAAVIYGPDIKKEVRKQLQEAASLMEANAEITGAVVRFNSSVKEAKEHAAQAFRNTSYQMGKRIAKTKKLFGLEPNIRQKRIRSNSFVLKLK